MSISNTNTNIIVLLLLKPPLSLTLCAWRFRGREVLRPRGRPVLGPPKAPRPDVSYMCICMCVCVYIYIYIYIHIYSAPDPDHKLPHHDTLFGGSAALVPLIA